MYNYGRNNRVSGPFPRNRDVYVKNLFGQGIRQNPVPVETAAARNNPFIIFEDPDSQKRIGFNKNILSTGMLVMGAPGTGKTNLLSMVTAQLLRTLEPNGIVVIFDSKGDYYREFWRHGNSGYKQYLIGSTEDYGREVCAWNIFGEIMERDSSGRLLYRGSGSDTDAFEIAEQLFKNMPSQNQPVFPKMAAQLLSTILIYFMRTYTERNPAMLNNQVLKDFLFSVTAEKLRQMLSKDYMRDQRGVSDYISANKGGQTQGVISYLQTVARQTFIGSFGLRASAGRLSNAHPDGNEVSMRQLVRQGEPAVLFVEYDLRRGNVMAPVYGLLCDQLLKHSLGGRHSNRANVYLIIDEWKLLPELEYMGNALSFGRSQGVKVICGLQNYPAIASIYGEERAKDIIAGFQSVISFRLTDSDSRRYIGERFGKSYQNVSFSAQNNSANVQREGRCVEEWDLCNLQRGQAAVLLSGNAPFLFQFPKYG